MRNKRKSTDVHSRADKALIQVRDAVVSAVQSAQLPQHVRALCFILIRNRRMRVVEGKFVAFSITAAVNACDTETS
jgi:ribosomal protein L14